MTTEARSKAIFGSSGVDSKLRQSFSRIGLLRPSRFSFAASKRNAVIAGKFDAVFHGDQLRVAIDFEILRGIDFKNIQIFVNRFRLHVVLRADFRRDLVPGGARDDDADESVRRRIWCCRSVRSPASRGARNETDRKETRYSAIGEHANW